jgi:hypothetical protein
VRSTAKVALDRSIPAAAAWSFPTVNEHDYNSLFSSLNEAVEILARNRTSDPAFIAAYDTLKQSRAMLVKVLNSPPESARDLTRELIAA